MQVIGSDGQHIGTVDKVEGDKIKLIKSDTGSGGVHHYTAMDQVMEINSGGIYLTKSANEIMYGSGLAR